ncbi:MAG TPA: anthrone oxygenase family protein [Bryobacteraceae bacterium]|nr:anthrone oxygenase family protein [Bryobacteraceae bacterium]
MHILNIITITSAGLMTGNELAVSAFVNPAVWRLERGPKAQALSILARSLGRAMPVWYGFCFALIALEAFLHRHQTTLAALLTAAVIWMGAILLSILVLVPINNRIAALNTVAPAPDWERDHRKWDALHRIRILLLIVALVVLINALAA